MSYFDRFAHARESDDYQLYGNLLIVEEYLAAPMTKAVQTADGRTVNLILDAGTMGGSRQVTSMAEQKPMLLRILVSGKGYFNDETGETVELDERPGNIIEVPKMSPEWRSEICGVVTDSGGRIGLVKASDVMGRYKDEAAYLRVCEKGKGK